MLVATMKDVMANSFKIDTFGIGELLWKALNEQIEGRAS